MTKELDNERRRRRIINNNNNKVADHSHLCRPLERASTSTHEPTNEHPLHSQQQNLDTSACAMHRGSAPGNHRTRRHQRKAQTTSSPGDHRGGQSKRLNDAGLASRGEYRKVLHTSGVINAWPHSRRGWTTHTPFLAASFSWSIEDNTDATGADSTTMSCCDCPARQLL